MEPTEPLALLTNAPPCIWIEHAIIVCESTHAHESNHASMGQGIMGLAIR